MKKQKYTMKKDRTTLAINPNLHLAVKAYAESRQLRLEDATEELLKIGLKSAFGG